jgi:hypothetical protein
MSKEKTAEYDGLCRRNAELERQLKAVMGLIAVARHEGRSISPEELKSAIETADKRFESAPDQAITRPPIQNANLGPLRATEDLF